MISIAQYSYQGFSFLCALASLSIIVTGLTFHSLLGHRLYHIIFFLSVSQFFVSLAGTLGAPHYQTESTACHIKSTLWFIFFPCSYLWSVACALSLHDCIISSRIRSNYLDVVTSSRNKKGIANASPSRSLLSHHMLHNMIWVPVLGFYALSWYLNMNPQEIVCTGLDNTGYFVLFCVIYGLLCLCLALIIVSFIILYVVIYRRKRSSPLPSEKKTLRVFQMYALSLVVVWMIEIVAYTIIVCIGNVYDGNDNIQALELALALIPTAPGLLNAINFFWYSNEARQRWSHAWMIWNNRNSNYQTIRDTGGPHDGGDNDNMIDAWIDDSMLDDEEDEIDGLKDRSRSVDSVETGFAESVRSMSRSD